MKRFLFPLDRVRLWRAGQAALEELKLEQLGIQMAKMSEDMRSAQAERTESEHEVLRQPAMEATELQNLDAYRLFTRDKIRDIENRRHQLEVQADEQRQRVIRARRDAELLERLKRKAVEEWQAASQKEQESFAAELYLARWTPRR